jgi:hypothetical protein
MRYFKITLIVAVITSLFSAYLIYKPTIKSVMAANHLLPEPENLTELYFENHTSLPKTIQPDGVYGFSFTIHNLENKTVLYPYQVYIQTGDLKLSLDQGKVTLNNNQSMTVKENFSAPENIRSQIIVELEGRNQQISFWMEPAI